MKIEDVYNKYSNEQIDEFEKIAESKCCWGCKKRNKSCSDYELFLNERDGIVLLDYIEFLEKERNEKDKQIEILEKALCNTCYLLFGTDDEHYPTYFKKQAEKELGEE